MAAHALWKLGSGETDIRKSDHLDIRAPEACFIQFLDWEIIVITAQRCILVLVIGSAVNQNNVRDQPKNPLPPHSIVRAGSGAGGQRHPQTTRYPALHPKRISKGSARLLHSTWNQRVVPVRWADRYNHPLHFCHVCHIPGAWEHNTTKPECKIYYSP